MPRLSNLRGVFITGTGTDVGKTVVTAALTRALWVNHSADFTGYIAIKPIQTGIEANNVQIEGDSANYAQALSSCTHIEKKFLPRTLHSFSLPASPHLAAKEENKTLSVQGLCSDIINCYVENAPLIIEGAGGVCVPLNDKETSFELMQELALPIVLVMENVLGALNHTLLSFESLKNRNLKVVALVCTHREGGKESLIQQDNLKFLAEHIDIPIYSLPYFEDLGANSHQGNAMAWHEAANCIAPLAKSLVRYWYDLENTNKSALLEWDKAHLWHPYTSATNPLPVYEVSHTKGMHIYLQDKPEPLVDGMSSWWCAVHGYGHKELINAATKQAQSMSHVMFGGLTHAPAINAAKKLLQLLNLDNQAHKKLSRLFWADSGSVAVEVALKMALQYQQGRGQKKRTKFLSPRGGYYGDTLGAMSVCDPINGMHTLFNNVLCQQIFIERPRCPFDGTMHKDFDFNCIVELEQAFNKYGHELAAVIIEPIVQGAGGMWFYDPRYLIQLEKLCKEYDVLLILDEIATGLGRTGKIFAAHWANITPDICCVGKALTGGFMSLAATICTEDVARDICANEQVFMHGPTFMGNALACAVAEASLDIFTRNTWQEQVLRMENELKQGLAPCAVLEDVADVRVLGAIGVVEMKDFVNVRALQEFFVKNNVWIRPFSKLIYIMPPYIAASADIELLTSVIYKAITNGIHKL